MSESFDNSKKPSTSFRPVFLWFYAIFIWIFGGALIGYSVKPIGYWPVLEVLFESIAVIGILFSVAAPLLKNAALFYIYLTSLIMKLLFYVAVALWLGTLELPCTWKWDSEPLIVFTAKQYKNTGQDKKIVTLLASELSSKLLTTVLGLVVVLTISVIFLTLYYASIGCRVVRYGLRAMQDRDNSGQSVYVAPPVTIPLIQPSAPSYSFSEQA